MTQRCSPGATILAVLIRASALWRTLAGFDLADDSPVAHALEVRLSKGTTDRLVHLSRSVAPALDDWIVARGRWPGPLCCRIRTGDRLTHDRLSEQAVYGITQRRAEEADGQRLTPHDVRRTCVSGLLESGADLGIGSAIAGHTDPRDQTRQPARRGRPKRAVAQREAPDVARTQRERPGPHAREANVLRGEHALAQG